MAYRFHLKAPVGKEARRILLEQIERAESQLEAAGHAASVNPDGTRTGIHETRKALKRIRALLKLIRPGLAEEHYSQENARFRDIGRLLAASRDRAVLIETLHKLGASDVALEAPVAALVRHFGEAGESDAAQGPGLAAQIETAAANLRAAKHAVRRIRLDPDSFAPIEQSLAAGFKRAVEAEARSAETNDDELVHAWRKTVQQHWRHMALLQRAWPDYFLARVAIARRISQLLGDDHDLSLLAASLGKLPEGILPELQQQAVIDAALAGQRRLRAEARLLNALLFSGSSKAFARTIREIWEASGALPDDARPRRQDR